MGRYVRYTKEQEQEVINLVKKRKSDAEIIRKTGYGGFFVRRISTQYWEEKMKLKNK